MDKRTEETKEWLDDRFQVTRDGVYYSHEPIYGLETKCSEYGKFAKWVVIYNLLRELRKWVPASILDVGAAEGWLAYLCRKFFGSKVMVTDLSIEACRRAKELYDIDGIACDVQNMPPMEQYDTVICNNMIEHVPDWKRSVDNLLKIAKSAVVLTLPIEGRRRVARKIAAKVPHCHLHVFRPNSFDYLRKDYDVKVIRIHSMLLYYLGAVLDYMPFLGEWPIIALIWMDKWFCRAIPWSRGAIFVIRPKTQAVTARAVVRSKIPYHYITGKSSK